MFPQSSRSYDDRGRNWSYGPIHEAESTSERQLGPHPFLTFRLWASGILTNNFLLGHLFAAGHSRALANAVANCKQSLTLMTSLFNIHMEWWGELKTGRSCHVTWRVLALVCFPSITQQNPGHLQIISSCLIVLDLSSYESTWTFYLRYQKYVLKLSILVAPVKAF